MVWQALSPMSSDRRIGRKQYLGLHHEGALTLASSALSAHRRIVVVPEDFEFCIIPRRLSNRHFFTTCDMLTGNLKSSQSVMMRP